MNVRGFLYGIATVSLSLLIPAAPVSATVLAAGPHQALARHPAFVGRPAASQTLDFVVHAPLRNRAELEQLTLMQGDENSPIYHHFLSVAQFRSRYAPTAATIARLSTALRSRGFAITKVESQLIHVSGTAATVERAFNVHLGLVRNKDGSTRAVPNEQLAELPELKAANAVVAGLAYQLPPQPDSHPVKVSPANRFSPSGPYWFDDLKQAYDYPENQALDGRGVTIATVGFSDFSGDDEKLYFNHEHLGGVGSIGSPPTQFHLRFPGSLPFNPNDGDSFEANLDVAMTSGSAPGATVFGIAAPATAGEGFLLAYSFIDEEDAFDVVSTSFGECELLFTAAYNGGQDFTGILQAYHDLFLQGNSEGITFVFSSGDDAGLPCPQIGYFFDGPGLSFSDLPGTSIWSDDPAVTSVGGTSLVTSFAPPALTSTYVSEQALDDKILGPEDPFGTGNVITNGLFGAGGGPSTIFPKPAYQNSANTGSSFRSDPDVGMQVGGCPFIVNPITGQPDRVQCNPTDSAVFLFVGLQLDAFIGTSVSAPEFAGLLAQRVQGLNSRLGNVNPYIYKLAAANATNHAFHQGIPSRNGVVNLPAGTLGWNPVVGVGTPDARVFVARTKDLPAGDPQTLSNP